MKLNQFSVLEGIELANHEDDAPSWFIIDAKGAIGSGPYDSKQQADSDSNRLKWFDPFLHYIEFGINDNGVFVDPETGEIGEDANQVPEIGNVVRTKKSEIEGKVERVDNNTVFFRMGDGRLMKTSLDNVVTIEKLADEDEELLEYTGTINRDEYMARRRGLQRLQLDPRTSLDKNLKQKIAKELALLNAAAAKSGIVTEDEDKLLNEISTEVLAKYKAAAGKEAAAADKKGDFKTGNKRFRGIVKATNKQFDNDAKKSPKHIDELSSGMLNRYVSAANANRSKTSSEQEKKGTRDPAVVDKMDKRAEYTIKAINKVGEGSMGGINRCAPANDVSYQNILNDVTDKWRGSRVKVK